MRTTSGCSVRARSIASRPSAASPTTAMSLLGVEQGPQAAAHQRVVVGQQDADHDVTAASHRQDRAHPEAAVDRAGLELAALEPSPLAHVDQPMAGHRFGRSGRTR